MEGHHISMLGSRRNIVLIERSTNQDYFRRQVIGHFVQKLRILHFNKKKIETALMKMMKHDAMEVVEKERLRLRNGREKGK